MAGVAVASPKQQYLDGDGIPLAGGFIYTYAAGTFIPKTTWQDRDQLVQNQNPIELDEFGSAQILLDPALAYRFEVTDADGMPQPHLSEDNVVGAAGTQVLGDVIAAKDAALVEINNASTAAIVDMDVRVVQAQTSANLAAASAKIFTTTAQGLAATTTGQEFLLRTADLSIFDVYYNNAGVATLLGQTNLANGMYLQASTGSLVHHAFTDSGTNTLAHISDTGVYDNTSGATVKLTGAPPEIESTSATGLAVASETSDHVTLSGVGPDGRFYLVGQGDVFANVATADLAAGLAYEQFGDVSRKYFLADKSANALKPRLRIHNVAAIYDSDVNVQGNREPWVMVLTETATVITGLVFFSQKNIYGGLHSVGENGMRSAVRDFTVDLVAKTITYSTTRVIYQPPQWTNSPAGGWVVNPVAWKVLSGPNIGKIRLLLNTFDTSNGLGLLDNGDYYIVECLSADNGQTWTAPVKVIGKEKIWDVLAGGTGGVPGPVPDMATGRSGVVSGTSNSMIRKRVAPNIGRIVVAINPLHNLGVSWWQGDVYSDDEGDTWTRSTLFLPDIANQLNEAQIVERADGAIVMYMRKELGSGPGLNAQARGMAVSMDGGVTFGAPTINTTAKGGNCSANLINSSFQGSDGFSKFMLGMPSSPRAGSRDNFAYQLSYDGGVTFIGRSPMYTPVRGVGYGCTIRTTLNKLYIHAGETFNGIDFWNLDNSIFLTVFNEAELLASAVFN